MRDLPFLKRKKWWPLSSKPSSTQTPPLQPQPQAQPTTPDSIPKQTIPRRIVPIRDSESPPQHSPLFRLPAELREHIWEYVYQEVYHCRIIIEDTPVLLRLGPIKRSSSESAFPSSPAAVGVGTEKAQDCTISRLLLTCRTIYNEAAPILYERTVFHFLVFGVLQTQIPRNGILQHAARVVASTHFAPLPTGTTLEVKILSLRPLTGT